MCIYLYIHKLYRNGHDTLLLILKVVVQINTSGKDNDISFVPGAAGQGSEQLGSSKHPRHSLGREERRTSTFN